MYDYEKNHQKDLKFDQGDQIVLLKEMKNGWGYGRNKKDNAVGLFPLNFVKKI